MHMTQAVIDQLPTAHNASPVGINNWAQESSSDKSIRVRLIKMNYNLFLG